MPSASIVIAAYNAEATLAEALASALAQEYTPLEIIVVDDGSTDGTAEVARQFPAVRYFWQPNQGPSAARNYGLGVAAGEYVGFLDADDWAPPTKMRIQIGYLLAHPDVGCVLGRQEVAFEGEGAPKWLGQDAVFGDFAGVPLMSLVAAKETLLDAGGFDPSLRIAEDRDLLVRLREQGVQLAVVPDVVLRRRFHGENLSFQRPAEHPVFASLKAKLARARATEDGTPRT